MSGKYRWDTYPQGSNTRSEDCPAIHFTLGTTRTQSLCFSFEDYLHRANDNNGVSECTVLCFNITMNYISFRCCNDVTKTCVMASWIVTGLCLWMTTDAGWACEWAGSLARDPYWYYPHLLTRGVCGNYWPYEEIWNQKQKEMPLEITKAPLIGWEL